MEEQSGVATRQYLTFTLDSETFALEIHKVREVLDLTTVTKVPQTPEFMRGVINLRGNVVPVVDLRLKFGLPVCAQTVHTCIIIVEVALEEETLVMGAMADSVQEVLDLEPDQVQPPPRIGTRLNLDFIRGMGRRGDDFVMILDVDAVFSSDELEALGLETATEAA
ncbi:chemotaxis protein CheW [Geomonas silvestris]|uniref:Chemotaxis protein CheW n=1 Tax=Geomonas silvestris TaxID=2740184 RepID=A0A6V8MK38_9BACT|nr:chemotaxis protein CheW [Geomonas silvestris]GFO60287.1 chemotaxis protein CheW [Geomonas silvestris]